MDITKIKSANAGEKIMINMRTYVIKNDIMLYDSNTLLANSGTEGANTLLANSGTEGANTIDKYWEITMKDKKFIIDYDTISKIINIKYNDYNEFTAKWYIVNNRVACVITGTKKTLYLDEYLMPKQNKLLHIHKDNNKLNYRLCNIQLVSQSIVNSRKGDKISYNTKEILLDNLKFDLTFNKEVNISNKIIDIEDNTEVNTEDNTEVNTEDNTEVNTEDNTTNNIAIKQNKLYDKLRYKIIDTKDNYIILENKDKSDDKIIEMTAKNNSNIKFIFDIKMLNKALKYSWSFHSGTGYIYNYISNNNEFNTNKRDMLYFHSFIYFLENPDLEKQKGYSIHHKNINKLDNRIVNLDYVNQSIQNAIRDNPKRITIQPNIQNIKEDLPKLTTYYPAKGEFGEYLEIDIKPMKNETIQFERIRKKTTKSKNCTLLDKVCHSIIIRYQIIHNLLTSNKKISLTRFCLEGKQFLNLIQLKKHHEHLINSIQDKYNEETINNNYTITFFEKYIKEKSKKKANSGSFKPTQISIE
jgi:hypothetical protein